MNNAATRGDSDDVRFLHNSLVVRALTQGLEIWILDLRQPEGVQTSPRRQPYLPDFKVLVRALYTLAVEAGLLQAYKSL